MPLSNEATNRGRRRRRLARLPRRQRETIHCPLGSITRPCGVWMRARESASVEREEFALLLGRRDDSTGCWPARIVPILHAFLEETIAPLALQSLLIRTELAGRHFLLCVNCKTRPPQQEHDQSGSRKRATRHAKPLCMSSRLLVRRVLGGDFAFTTMA